MARFAAFLFAACLTVSILGADTAFTQTAPRPPLPLTSHGKLEQKKEHRESATRKKNLGRVPRKKNLGRVLGKSKSGLSVRSRARSFSMMQTSELTTGSVFPISRATNGKLVAKGDTSNPSACPTNYPLIVLQVRPSPTRLQPLVRRRRRRGNWRF